MATTAQVESAARTASGVNSARAWSASVVSFASIYLLLRLFRGATPVLLTGDQVFFWSYGQRIAHGQLPYRDFFQITGPGADAAFAAAFRLFGESVVATNLVVLLLGVALAFTVFRLARSFASNAISACISALYAEKVYARYLSATHHFLSMLAIGLALLVLAKARTARSAFLAGLFLGGAVITTQTHGVFAALAMTLAILLSNEVSIRSRLHHCGSLWLGLLAIVLPAEGFLAAKVGIARLWYCQVIVPSRWPGSAASSPWWGEGSSKDAFELILLYALPCVVYALSALRLTRQTGARRSSVLFLLLVGVSLACEVLTAPNAIRIVAVSLPAFALLAYVLRGFSNSRFLPVAASLVILIIAARGVWITQHGDLRTLALPSGRVAAAPPLAEKLDWLQRHAGKEDLTFEAAYPGIYLPLHRLDPLYTDNLMPIRLTPAEVLDRSVQELEQQRVKYIIWNDALDATPPAETRASFERFTRYVRTQYKLAIAFESGETILERR